MKKLFMMVVTSAVLLSSCGSSKPTPVASSNVRSSIGEALPDEPCIILAEEAPTIRKYGNAQHFKEMTARNLAENQARAAFARSIATAVKTATEEINVSLEKYAGDNNEGRSVGDQSGESNDFTMSIASEIVKNTHVIKTSRYLKSNNQYNIYVCLEYMGSENQMAEQIENSLKDKISPDDRAKLEKRHDEFRQRALKALQ